MRKNSLMKFLPVMLALVFALTPLLVAAAGEAPDITGTLANTGAAFGAQEKSLPEVIGQILRVVLGFMGVVLLVVIIYGGFLYMTAGGDDSKTKKGKDWIINGIIGLLIVLLAYAITNYVVGELVNATLGG